MRNKRGAYQISLGLLILLVLLAIFVLPSLLKQYQEPDVALEVKIIDETVKPGPLFEIYMKISNNLDEDIEINNIQINDSNILPKEELTKYFPEILEANSFVEKKVEARIFTDSMRGLNKFSVSLNYTVADKSFKISSPVDITIN